MDKRIMTRIIDGCYNCDYFEDYNDNQINSKPMCAKCNKEVKDSNTIPNFCPLEKFEEKVSLCHHCDLPKSYCECND